MVLFKEFSKNICRNFTDYCSKECYLLVIKLVDRYLIGGQIPTIFHISLYRVDSRLRECDNYVFFAILAQNFTFPA